MNTITRDLLRQCVVGLKALVLATVVLGAAYPLLVGGVGQLAFGDAADGSPVELDGEVVGSSLLGQSFPVEDDEWFHSRPSANDHDTLASAPSNLGPSNEDLLATIEERRAAVADVEGVDPADVPADALTGSGSGLDPHISREYAELQVARVADARGLDERTVRDLVAEHTSGRVLGFLGEPRVDVLELNVALESARAAD